MSSRSTQVGIFWTAPQVPSSATDAKQIARRAVRRSLGEPNNSASGREGAFFCASFHLCDSGTKIWIRNVRTAGAAPAKKEEQTEFAIILTGFDAAKKINVIKVVREITGLGLKEAKDLVEGHPKTVKENLPKADAEKIKKQLEDGGAKVDLK